MADRARAEAVGYGRGPLRVGALLTLGAGAIHLAQVPDHLQEYLPFGLVFLLVGAAQVGLAVALFVAPSRRIVVAAVLLAAACAAVWAVSRTAGLPFGPPGKPEALVGTDPLGVVLQVATSSGLPETLATVFEIFALLALGPPLARGPRSRRRRHWWLAGTLPAAVPVLALTAAGIAAALNPPPVAVDMSVAAPGRPPVSMASLHEAPGPQPLRSFTLTARVARIGSVEAWTYDGTVPGPELRVTQGDRVRVKLVNHLPESTSIHWHGLRLPNAEDGVAGLTQDAVPPGGTYTYEFVVRDVGTYWYHSHQNTEHQVPFGLYGALVVEAPGGPAYDRDYAAIVGDANNAASALHLDARPGELVRLRVISAYQEDLTGDPELLVLAGAPYRVVALDGHDLNQPQELGPEVLPVGTGQRFDLVFRMPDGGQVRLFDDREQTGNRVVRREWASLGEGAAPQVAGAAVLPRFDLTAYGAPAPDPVASRTEFDVTRDLRITSNVGFRYGSYQFVHMFNDRAFPDTEPVVVREGQYVRLRIVNATTEFHPIHLHGHFLSVIGRNGRPLAGSPVHLDSILVGPHETWDVAFLADNPGLWMLHCHVLVHAEYGLSSMVSYEGISTPYTIGTRSGNFPE